MKECVICSAAIKPFMSFGKQPIANGFLTENQFKNEYFFEMQVCFCDKCKMFQLLDQPEKEKMFNENYAFFSGTSKHMGIHFQNFAGEIRERFLTEKDPFVVEIGSNDGIMLKNFANAGIRHLGIEPSANVAEAARKQGVRTLNKFFDVQTAKEIVAENGKADAFLAANVMCHIPFMHSVLEGMEALMKPTGVIAFEDPYLGDVIQKTSYDQIYDEHMFLFSLTSISYLFEKHGFELFDAAPQPTHGGSMRYYLGFKGAHKISSRLKELFAKEQELGLNKSEAYERFRQNCEKSREDLTTLLKKLKSEGKTVAGYAATSKSTTILNYCNIGPDLIEYICDTTPIKQGKYSPGKHIPIADMDRFKGKNPDYAVLFGWNHRNEIFAKEQDFVKGGGRWIEFVPKVAVN
ncbi:MAG: class I SAM-dependent methyltransferase [Oligoflexales bacterium]